MSASSKKKLRSEQDAAKLTERQLAEQKEAKTVKAYTIGFVVVLVILVAVALFVSGHQLIVNSGVREKNTVAVTVGDHEVNTVEFNYFYTDVVNNFMQQYGSLISMIGIDTTKPLNEQILDPESGDTWADKFVVDAKDSIATVYALADAAEAAGYTLPEDLQSQTDIMLSNMDTYAAMSGMSSAKSYLRAVYGHGADLDSYRSYVELSMLAQSYQQVYAESLTYDDAALREAEKENYNEFSSFTYNEVYLGSSSFLTGGTTAEDGTVTYSDEEKAAALKAAEAAANALADGSVKSVADFDAAVAAIEFTSESAPTASTAVVNKEYASISEPIAQWLSDSARKEGDISVIPSTSETMNEEGTPEEITNGYYVVYFTSVNDNTYALPNVRHILVSFEGGTPDEAGNVTYSEEEKSAAKTKAEELLAQWEAGDKTEDSFAALAAENSTDPGSKENGGLYEDIAPGQMVPTFNDWCFDESRKAGDTGIVETSYGYHVMYFSGDSETTYRDLQIRNKLTAADFEAWFKNLVDSITVTDGDVSFVRTDMVLGGR